MLNRATALSDKLACVGDKKVGGGTFPFRVAWWEMATDITFTDGTQQRINYGMKGYIGIGMASKAKFVLQS